MQIWLCPDCNAECRFEEGEKNRVCECGHEFKTLAIPREKPQTIPKLQVGMSWDMGKFRYQCVKALSGNRFMVKLVGPAKRD